MATRKEDITVRILADYAKAEADMQRFTGGASKSFAAIPASVNAATQSVDKLTSQLARNDAAIVALPKHLQDVSSAVDRLNQTVDKMGQLLGPDKLKNKLRDTSDEASRLTKMLNGVATAGKFAGATAAGFQAGKMVLMPQVERQMDYSTKLAHLANTTFSDKTVAERIAGKSDLNATILAATRAGGGTRDDALSALDKMIASGAVSAKDAQTMLPAVVKGATASNSSPEEIASIAIRGMQNFGFKAEDMQTVIDMAIKSGQLGGFELKDMAKWLPQQMAEAATLGMRGKEGFAQLLALNQAAITAAGTTDGAGNNVVNLLAKINSDDTQKDFKKQGINLTGKLQQGVAKGVDPITTFSHLIDGIMQKDKVYQSLEAKLKAAGSDKEKTSIIEQQLQLAEGTAIGKVLQDRQARSAYLGYKKQGDSFAKMVDTTLNGAAGTTAGNYAVLESESGFKRNQALNEELNAQTTALSKLNPVLNTYYDYTVKTAQEYPTLTAALSGGKIMVETLAASAGVAALALQLLSKNAPAAALAGSGGKPLTGGAYGAGMGKLGKALNLVTAFGTGWEVGSLLNDYAINPLTKWATNGKSESLGVLAYNLTHKDEADKPVEKNSAAPVPKKSFSESMAIKQQTISPLISPVSPANAVKGAFDPMLPAITLPAVTAVAQQTSLKSPSVAPVIGSAPAVAPVVKAAIDPVIPATTMPAVASVPKLATAATTTGALASLTDDRRPSVSPISKTVGSPEPIDPAASGAMQRQMSSPLMSDSAMQRLFDGLKPLPVEARIKLDVAFNESGRPYVQQKSVEGKGVRLDTGPMMTR